MHVHPPTLVHTHECTYTHTHMHTKESFGSHESWAEIEKCVYSRTSPDVLTILAQDKQARTGWEVIGWDIGKAKS